MKFTLSEEIFKLDPEAKVGVLIASNIDNSNNSDGSYQNLWEQIEGSARTLAKTDLTALRSVSLWQDAFRKAGMNPNDTDASHIALLKRVQERLDIPNINNLVNVLNTMSIKHQIPVGGHDLDKIKGNVTVGPNVQGLSFFPMNSDDEVPVPKDEIVYADEENVHTRKWVWREGRKVMSTEETTDVFIPMDSFEYHSEDDLRDIAREVAALLTLFVGTATTKFTFDIVTKDNPAIDLASLPKLTKIEKLKIKTHKISRDEALIDRLTNRGIENIYPSPDVLRQWLLSGRRLNIYQGFDPTADTLHIGHTVGMRKLRDFQKLGHNVTFLVGDFTARVGDPDKLSTRVKMTKEEVEANMTVFKEQASKILDFDDKENPVQILYNSTWLDELKFGDILELASEFTVQQMIKRDMFRKRLELDRPIYILEFMYPLMQSYDSQHMNIDVEVGGNDQTFNMLTGRQLTISWLNKEKAVVSCKLLEAPGGAKMGKTDGNMIKLSDTPEDMFGQVMSFSDELIVPGFEILTDVPMDEVEEMKNKMASGKTNPMDLKKKLAFTITEEHKGTEAAQKAQKHFESIFQNKAADAETVQTVTVPTDSVGIIELLVVHTKFAESNSQAKRLVDQGAVSLDGKKVTDKGVIIQAKGQLLRAGKKVAKISFLKR